MLVLTRKVSQSIVIAGDIVVTIVKVRGNVVSVGIEAERSVPVHRAEIAQRIESEEAESERSGGHGNAIAPPAPLVSMVRSSLVPAA